MNHIAEFLNEQSINESLKKDLANALPMAQRCQWHSVANGTALQMAQRCQWHIDIDGLTNYNGNEIVQQDQ